MEPQSSVNFPYKQTGILIADDHQLFSDGLQTMLQAEPNIFVSGRVFNGNDVLSAVQVHRPDLVLLDINLPGKDGLTLASELKRTMLHLRIILLTMYSDKQFTNRARETGIDGYMLKTASRTELLTAINTVLAGGSYYYAIDDEDKRHNSDPFMQKYKLTAREQEIIYLIREGLSNNQIAERIFLSLYTVETHRRNINLKLGVKKPSELILKAIEIGL